MGGMQSWLHERGVDNFCSACMMAISYDVNEGLCSNANSVSHNSVAAGHNCTPSLQQCNSGRRGANVSSIPVQVGTQTGLLTAIAPCLAGSC